jgi:integrase
MASREGSGSHREKRRHSEAAKSSKPRRPKTSPAKSPDALLIYERAGKLHPYRRWGIDERIRTVSERAGIQFTNHTLRRTLGRSCWLAGDPLETIRDLLGHEDTKTTIQYLGINMDDKSSAMAQLARYQNALKRGKKTSSQTREVDGPGFEPGAS